MANVADSLPPELLSPLRKAAVIEFIRDMRLPSRFRRKLLQDWSEAVGVDLSAADYEAVTEVAK